MERLVKMQCMLTCLVFLVTQKKNIPRDFPESRENFGVCLFLDA